MIKVSINNPTKEQVDLIVKVATQGIQKMATHNKYTKDYIATTTIEDNGTIAISINGDKKITKMWISPKYKDGVQYISIATKTIDDMITTFKYGVCHEPLAKSIVMDIFSQVEDGFMNILNKAKLKAMEQ